MGKIKRERQKFHIVAENKNATTVEQKAPIKYKSLKTQLDAVENIFSGINIQLDSINKFEEIVSAPTDESKSNEEKTVKSNVVEPDVKSSEAKVDNKVSTVSGKHQTKKEKMALKHQKLMEKLDVTHKARMQHKKKTKKQQKQNEHLADQTLAVSKTEFRSLLTPAAVKSSNVANKNANPVPKNVFSIPLLNDDLPALSSIFEKKLNQTNADAHKITMKSKNIGKKGNPKKNFFANYNILKKAMEKKMK